MKLNLAGDHNTINSIDLKWYLHNSSTGTYEVDPTSKAFLEVVDYLEITITDYSQSGSDSFDIGDDNPQEDITTSIMHITPKAHTWKLLNAGAGEAVINPVCLTYEIYGVRFSLI